MTIEILAAAALALTTHSPSLPKPLIAPELRATDCAVPDERAFLLGQGEAAVAAVQPLMESSGRMEARMTAHAERLIARGVWTEADRARFGRHLVASPEFEAHGSKVMAIVSSLITTIETLGAAPQDEERSCRAVLSMLETVDRTVSLAEEGWSLIDRAYSDEARRLGVSLD